MSTELFTIILVQIVTASLFFFIFKRVWTNMYISSKDTNLLTSRQFSVIAIKNPVETSLWTLSAYFITSLQSYYARSAVIHNSAKQSVNILFWRWYANSYIYLIIYYFSYYSSWPNADFSLPCLHDFRSTMAIYGPKFGCSCSSLMQKPGNSINPIQSLNYSFMRRKSSFYSL